MIMSVIYIICRSRRRGSDSKILSFSGTKVSSQVFARRDHPPGHGGVCFGRWQRDLQRGSDSEQQAAREPQWFRLHGGFDRGSLLQQLPLLPVGFNVRCVAIQDDF